MKNYLTRGSSALKPYNSLERRSKFVKSGLLRLLLNNISLDNEKDITRIRILETYGENGLKKMKRIQTYVKKHGLTETLQMLGYSPIIEYKKLA